MGNRGCQVFLAYTLRRKLEERNYDRNSEDSERFKVYVENMEFIQEHNEKFNKQLAWRSVELNHFGDMRLNEFEHLAGCGNVSEMEDDEYNADVNITTLLGEGEIPEYVDLRESRCGNCWAFSSGQLKAIIIGKLANSSLSANKNLFDCAPTTKELSCHISSSPVTCFKYVMANDGIDTEESYPFERKRGECRFKKENVGATITGYVKLQKGNEEQLERAVAKIGPISVFINPSHRPFKFYKYGILDNPSCNAHHGSHVVLAVGYGVQDGIKYWLLKNSYGEKWGDHGYFKIIRGKNMCGVTSSPTFPLVEQIVY